MNKSRLSKYAIGVTLIAVAHWASAVESERPAKIGRTDIAGAIFKGPQVKKITEGATQALEVDTLVSADRKFSSGMYKAGPEHLDIKDGYPEYEFFYVITGSITLTDTGGAAQVIQAGEAVTIPKGWKGHWDSDGYTKIWVTYETAPK
ncbi:MAG TPA: cupin domain-containing protein [Steroidobacteraceae bacterium]|nr:cupin domain-containing protein [Steroidobacteraceae bacterium]